jgi:hypothetical protein
MKGGPCGGAASLPVKKLRFLTGFGHACRIAGWLRRECDLAFAVGVAVHHGIGYQVRQDSLEMKRPWPARLLQVSPVTRDVHVKTFWCQVRPYGRVT